MPRPALRFALTAIFATAILAALAAGAVAAFPITANKTYERGDHPFATNLANLAGLPRATPYELIYGAESAYDLHGDRVIYYCLQVKADPWTIMEDGDWRAGTHPSDLMHAASSIGRLPDCFGLPSDAAYDEAPSITWQAATGPDAIEATFLSTRTGRLLYVDFAH